MSNKRLAEIKALIAARNPTIDDMDTLRFINDLRTASGDALAEIERLTKECHDSEANSMQYATDLEKAESEIERLRAELRERCEYLRENQFSSFDEGLMVWRCYACDNRVKDDHAPDCRHARLMRFPEGV